MAPVAGVPPVTPALVPAGEAPEVPLAAGSAVPLGGRTAMGESVWAPVVLSWPWAPASTVGSGWPTAPLSVPVWLAAGVPVAPAAAPVVPGVAGVVGVTVELCVVPVEPVPARVFFPTGKNEPPEMRVAIMPAITATRATPMRRSGQLRLSQSMGSSYPRATGRIPAAPRPHQR